MNLSIILEFFWFRGWGFEIGLHIDPLDWCWFDHRLSHGNFNDEDSIVKKLGFESNTTWFNFDVSTLCLTLIVEGMKYDESVS